MQQIRGWIVGSEGVRVGVTEKAEEIKQIGINTRRGEMLKSKKKKGK